MNLLNLKLPILLKLEILRINNSNLYYLMEWKLLPVDLMDFILDDKDFVNRAESDLLQFTPSFNF